MFGIPLSMGIVVDREQGLAMSLSYFCRNFKNPEVGTFAGNQVKIPVCLRLLCGLADSPVEVSGGVVVSEFFKPLARQLKQTIKKSQGASFGLSISLY